MSAHPIADLELVRRLERAEATANAGSIEAHAALDPASGATWTEVAGVYAMYDGAESPLTQTFGLGVFDPVGDAELDALERFFTGRGAPVHHEASPYIGFELLERLVARGYQPIEHSTVLVRTTTLGAPATSHVSVRQAASDEADAWARVAGQGWSSEGAELAAFIESFGRVLARARGMHLFLAELEGRPIAAGGLALHGDVAILAGASTIPSARRQGAQRALLDTRLRFAAERGASLAMVVALPGSGSQRNAERNGFRPAYTRTKWRLRAI